MKYLDKWLESPFEISLPTFPIKHESASRIFGEALNLIIATMSKGAPSKPICLVNHFGTRKEQESISQYYIETILIYRIVLGAR